MAESIVQPQGAAPSAPTVEPTAAPEPAPEAGTDTQGGKSSLPAELVQIPAIQALIAGQPPAVSAEIQSFSSRPEGKLIAANKDPLMKAGLGFYRSLGGDVGVLFNQFFINGNEIKAADEAGTLPQIAPPFDSVNAEVSKAGAAHPILQEGERPRTFRQPSLAQSSPAPAPTGSPAPTPASTKTIGAKARNLQPGSPTSGPAPGAGRLMNQILKPVV